VTERTLPDDLVPVEWLAAHLENERVRVVDIRGYVKTEDLGGGRQKGTYTGAPEEYERGHIPGAVYVDWTKDIVDQDGTVKAQIAPPEQFKAAMDAKGIGEGIAVVVADHTGGHLATRLWWALRYYSHDDVAVLEGGYGAWGAAGLPLTTDPTDVVSNVTFTPRKREELRSEVDDVLRQMHTQSHQIVDARDGVTFRGEIQRGRRGGHIPGAINLPASSLIGKNGEWRSPEEIRGLARAAGVDVARPVTAYCNGGVTATQLMFGLHRAGMTDLSNYDGSWNEWGEREDLPAEDNRDLFGSDENV
jgi:thiosulfate/3-mercaptopyruvate sulfurtransferase